MVRLKDRLQWNVVSFSRIDDVFSFPCCWNDSIANFVPETSSLGVSGQSTSLNIKIFMIFILIYLKLLSDEHKTCWDQNRTVDMQKRIGWPLSGECGSGWLWSEGRQLRCLRSRLPKQVKSQTFARLTFTIQNNLIWNSFWIHRMKVVAVAEPVEHRRKRFQPNTFPSRP